MRFTVLLFILQFFVRISPAQFIYSIREFGPDKTSPGYPIDGVAQILINGYLKGEIHGYPNPKEDSVARWSAALPYNNVTPWDPKIDYFAGDHVLHKGKLYEAFRDAVGQDPDKNPSSWQELEMRTPVSRKEYYPLIKDTLPKAAFLKNMVLEPPQNLPAWNASYNYYQQDIVVTDAGNYQAMTDSKGLDPADHPEAWYKTNEGSLLFGNYFQLMPPRVFFKASTEKNDTTWTPQMIIVGVMDITTGEFRQVICFYFDEAISYLQPLAQPVASRFGLGYIDNFIFAMTSDERLQMIDFLREQIKLKKLPVPKGTNARDPLFLDWLNGTKSENTTADIASIRNAKTYSLFQNLITRDLTIDLSVGYGNTMGKNLVSIPIKSVQGVIKDKTPIQPIIYTTALQNIHNYSHSSVGIDSLAPIQTYVPLQRPAKKNFFFEETYTARLDSGHNPSIGKALESIWKSLQTALNKKQIKLQGPLYTMYPDSYNWTKLNPWKWDESLIYTLSRQFSMNPVAYMPDSVFKTSNVNSVAITYRKNVAYQGKTKNYFVPVNIAFSYPIGNGDVDRDDYLALAWSDFKTLVARSGLPDTVPFIKAVESGNLEFSRSEISYGLHEK